MTIKKAYCLVLTHKNTDTNTEIIKNHIEELTEIIELLDFDDKISEIKLFRCDNS